MKLKSILISTLALSILTSCTNSTNNNFIESDNLEVLAKKTVRNNIETLVNKERMESYLKVLTGKTPVQGTSVIPERGTVEGREMTRNFLQKTLTDLGYKVEIHNYRKNGSNVVAKLMADTPTDEYLLVGAHMDSVRNAGADDNGSGSTAVLEAATVLPKLEGRKVNIIFAWFDEEELGLIGSKALAKDYKKQGLKLLSAHTADMIGYDSDKDRVIEIEQPDGNLWDVYNQSNKDHGLNFKLSRTSSGQTDHEAFRAYGFKSVGLCEEWAGQDTTPEYHKKTDAYNTISFDMIEATTKLMVAVASDLSQKVAVRNPTAFVPHTQFPKKERHFHYKGFTDLE